MHIIMGGDVKVFLVENSDEFRIKLLEGLSKIININIIGTADDPDIAISSIEKLQPEIVIFDNNFFPEYNSAEEISAYESVKMSNPDVKLIIMDKSKGPGCCKNMKECLVDYCAQDYDSLEEIIKKLAQQRVIL